jgi:hypothetical protein
MPVVQDGQYSSARSRWSTMQSSPKKTCLSTPCFMTGNTLVTIHDGEHSSGDHEVNELHGESSANRGPSGRVSPIDPGCGLLDGAGLDGPLFDSVDDPGLCGSGSSSNQFSTSGRSDQPGLDGALFRSGAFVTASATRRLSLPRPLHPFRATGIGAYNQGERAIDKLRRVKERADALASTRRKHRGLTYFIFARVDISY